MVAGRGWAGTFTLRGRSRLASFDHGTGGILQFHLRSFLGFGLLLLVPLLVLPVLDDPKGFAVLEGIGAKPRSVFQVIRCGRPELIHVVITSRPFKLPGVNVCHNATRQEFHRSIQQVGREHQLAEIVIPEVFRSAVLRNEVPKDKSRRGRRLNDLHDDLEDRQGFSANQ